MYDLFTHALQCSNNAEKTIGGEERMRQRPVSNFAWLGVSFIGRAL